MVQLRSLRHLVTLASRLNYARAAEDLGLSQSALSRSIQALERELNMRLLDRDRGGVALTPQGRIAVERAVVLLGDADDFERQMALAADASGGRIRFGMAPMPARALLPAVVSETFRTSPEVGVEVIVRDADALWEKLVTGEIEFFVINEGFHFDPPTPRIETLGHFPIALIVRAGHPLLADDCAGRSFPVVRSSWTGLPLPAALTPYMAGPPSVIEDFGSLAGITAASDAIWFSSPYAVPGRIRSGELAVLPLGDPIDVRVMMYSLERRSHSPLARALKGLLRHEIKRLGEGDANA